MTKEKQEYHIFLNYKNIEVLYEIQNVYTVFIFYVINLCFVLFFFKSSIDINIIIILQYYYIVPFYNSSDSTRDPT